MLKVYTVNHYVSVDGGKWYRVGRCGETMMDDSKSTEDILDFNTFDEWCAYLQKNQLPGIYYQPTFFKKKPCIVTYEWSYDTYTKYTSFNTLSYKTVYKEYTSASLAYIMDRFSADQVIQYLKERGITTCPMNF